MSELDFSMLIVLKSGKVLVSDTARLSQQDVQVLYNQVQNALRESNTSGVINTTRNEKAVLVPIAAVEYVEFSMTTLEDTSEQPVQA